MEEDIKSPLPPRGFNVETVEEPVIEPVVTGTASVSTSSVKSDGSKVKFLIIGGIVVAILIILFLVFKVILPNVGNINKPKEITLNYWGLWEESSVIDGVIADFEAKNPGIKINYIKNQKDDYRSRLQGRLAKDPSMGDVPDVFRIHASWLPMFETELANVPTATVNTLQMDSDFFETYKEDLKVNGSYKVIPLMFDGLALFYNKDLIESASVELPKSWWDLQNTAVKLTVKDESGRIKIAGAAIGLVDNVDHWSDIVGLMSKQAGVNIFDDTPESNNQLRDILIYYSNFATKYKIWDSSLPSSTVQFANGKLAFYLAPSWRAFNIEEMNPSLRFEIIGAPQLPTLKDVPLDKASSQEGALTNINWATYWAEAVNSKSPYQKEAWKFLEYLASKEGLEKLYLAQSQVRSFGEIYPRKSMASMISSNNKIKPFVAMADFASSGSLSSRTFDVGLNDDMAKYFGDAINSIVADTGDLEKAMTTLRSGINQLALKYHLK